MANDEGKDRPLWARKLSQKTWERVNELLYEGWQPAAVRRELKIPARHKRSLELYARKFRSRRVLAPLARLSELIAGGVEQLGPDFLKLLRLATEQALSNPKMQARMAAVLSKFMAGMLKLGAETQEAESKREREEQSQQVTSDAAETMRRMLADYGVRFDERKQPE